MTDHRPPQLPALEDLNKDLRDRGYSPSVIRPMSGLPSPTRGHTEPPIHPPTQETLPAYSHTDDSTPHPPAIRFIDKPLPAKAPHDVPPSSRQGQGPPPEVKQSRNPFKGWWPDRDHRPVLLGGRRELLELREREERLQREAKEREAAAAIQAQQQESCSCGHGQPAKRG